VQTVGDLIASSNLTAVVGIGATGLAVARYLAGRGERFIMVDTREQPPGLDALVAEFPNTPVELGSLNPETLLSVARIVVSPGLPLAHPVLRQVAARGIAVTGDIQLFADAAQAPIIAITGSNGKSTVTTLVGEMALEAGRNAGIGGNLGTPALDLLAAERDIYVVELSSFQLELVTRLGAEVATVLNISPDHMDRYPDLQHYHQAKHRIFTGVRQVVVNREDALTRPLVPDSVVQWSFGLDRPDFRGFGLIEHQGETCLALAFEPLLPIADVRIKGRHNIANALAALALGHAAGLPMAAMLAALRRFPGLPHRCQTVAQTSITDAGGRTGTVTWIDDSKATNIGATIAAIEGFAGSAANLILIAGGQGKGQEFAPLAEAVAGRVRLVILIGEDAPLIDAALKSSVDSVYATTMAGAVSAAASAANAGDLVLLSPACASFDMFAGYADRGRRFAAAVEALT